MCLLAFAAMLAALKTCTGQLMSSNRCSESCCDDPDLFHVPAVTGLYPETWLANSRRVRRASSVTILETSRDESGDGFWFYVGAVPPNLVINAGAFDLGGTLCVA